MVNRERRGSAQAREKKNEFFGVHQTSLHADCELK